LARRNKNNAFDGLVEITAKLPWWVGLLLAVVSYVVLHGIAATGVTAPMQPGSMGQVVIQTLFKTFAMIGQ
jgi:restriction system protein